MSDETQNYGDFTISYQFIDRDPEEVIANMTEEERLAYYKTNKVVEEENIEDTNTFWFFVGGGCLGAVLIGILIYCLIRMKKKNDLIVAKVEKLSKEAPANEDNKPDKNDDFYNSQMKKEEEQEPQRVAVSSPQKTDDLDGRLKIQKSDVGSFMTPQQAKMEPQLNSAQGVYGSHHTRAKTEMVINENDRADYPAHSEVSWRRDDTLDPEDARRTRTMDIEMEKIAKMKELLRQGKAELPVRKATLTKQSTQTGIVAKPAQLGLATFESSSVSYADNKPKLGLQVSSPGAV